MGHGKFSNSLKSEVYFFVSASSETVDDQLLQPTQPHFEFFVRIAIHIGISLCEDDMVDCPILFLCKVAIVLLYSVKEQVFGILSQLYDEVCLDPVPKCCFEHLMEKFSPSHQQGSCWFGFANHPHVAIQ